MSKLYFTRHGQTIWNVEGKVCGATDIELTELGHKQAIELGERIKADKNIKIDVIYSIDVNNFRGNSSIELRLKSYRVNGEKDDNRRFN